MNLPATASASPSTGAATRRAEEADLHLAGVGGPTGGYSFTREPLGARGVPWPPTGWRRGCAAARMAVIPQYRPDRSTSLNVVIEHADAFDWLATPQPCTVAASGPVWGRPSNSSRLKHDTRVQTLQVC